MNEQSANETAHQWVTQVVGLASPPDVCIRVFELIEQNASLQEIGTVICRDPNLAARLLKIVNSPYYHFSKRIDTLTRAITVVGIRELSSLVISVSAIKTFSNIPIELVNIDTFWRHSIYTGLIARALAQRCNVLHPERLFVAGLLHDIGSLVIYHRAPDLARTLLNQTAGDEYKLYRGELDALGFSHAYLGGMLLESWMIPEILRESITFHHQPSLAVDATLEAAIVHVAETLANRSEIGAFCEQADTDVGIDPSVWNAIGIREEQLEADKLISQADVKFTDMAAALSG